MSNKAKKTVCTILFMVLTVVCLAVPCFATGTGVGGDDLFSRAEGMLNSVYSQILGISTVVAVVCASIALLMMFTSKNQKTIDEARSWLKRIVICWSVLNLLGFFVTYLSDFVEGGRWNPSGK